MNELFDLSPGAWQLWLHMAARFTLLSFGGLVALLFWALMRSASLDSRDEEKEMKR